ncbi:MAG: D-alanine--D-alanine ligase [Aquificota bacterium]|nr:MAG: D-alanine--D-alanine ligase [Aquificota bacterium]
MEKMRIALLLGGPSSEREVSLKTGGAVASALRKKGLDVVELDVGEDLSKLVEDLKRVEPQVVFIALHGAFGEDGVIQGVLEYLGLSYTGSGVLASALAMDKLASKRLFSYHGIPVPRYTIFRREGWTLPGEVPLEELSYPLVVKPAAEGSTIGVSIVDKEEVLEAALRKAYKYGDTVLVEEYIEGREITVGILGDEPLPVIEIIPETGFYDYRAKYTPGLTRYEVPAKLPRDMALMVQDMALLAHRALGCKDVSRVDFRLSEDGTPYVLEVNTIPGMTETSLLPKAAAAAGISFEELVLRILESALKK